MIPTAEELYNNFHFNYKGDENLILEAMREFARLHVTAALERASQNAELEDIGSPDIGLSYHVVNEKSILNAYPLTSIK
jgi:hypothetical protein